MRGRERERVAWPLVVRSPARDSHLCASITDDHSRVHFVVHVFDAALTDKEGRKEGGREGGGGGGGGEAAGWMMLVVISAVSAAAAAAARRDVARRLAGIIYPSPRSSPSVSVSLCSVSFPTGPRSTHP